MEDQVKPCHSSANNPNMMISAERRWHMNDRTHAVEIARMRYACYVAIFGLGVSAALVVLLVFGAGMRASADIVAIVGTFTGVSGTLVGAFFGLQIGAAGREQERAERRDAERMTRMAFGVMTEDQYKETMKMVKGESSTGM